jgi:chromosome segregation ATPase
VTKPDEQIAHWAAEVEKAKSKRARYQDQEAEGLMTREVLRAKLAKLDETAELAETEIERLRHQEEGLRELQRGGEELLERYSRLVPQELEDLSSAERRHVHQLLRIEVWVPQEEDIRIRLPFLPGEGEFRSHELAS